ncbi:14806_t:CDS:1 [Dentiscutata erythropus]|uniref:14806_t:CDS:1 n=1 Tax=Dentiscutata erythropus TaxID=1348616 RepID=A0A9N8YSD1_9GLOM|nr:14806_t:CDS:1 [Dentiscutata erythropus]
MNQRFNSYIVFLLFKIKTCISLPQSGFSCGVGLDCGNSPYGPCCSQYGYCGNTSDYCNPYLGCQSGCWILNPSTTYIVTSTPSPSATSNFVTSTSESNSGGSNSDLLYKVLVPVILLAVIALIAFLFWKKWQKYQLEQKQREIEQKDRELKLQQDRMTALFDGLQNSRPVIGDNRMVYEEDNNRFEEVYDD